MVSRSYSLELKVEGPDMDTIIATLPASASSYSLEVPSGSDRIFTIISTASGDVTNNWGGQFATALVPGVEVELPIIMLPMTEIWSSYSSPGSSSIEIQWAFMSLGILSGYQVFRATNAEGPYSLIGTTGLTTSYNDMTCTAGNTYFYKVRVITSNGIGVESPYRAQLCN